jgi:hypothetical protein
MKQRFQYMLVAIAMLIAVPLPAQQSPQHPGSESGRQARSHEGPVQRLLVQRTALGLSADQVTRLEAIDRQMDETNRPLIQQLMQIRRQLPNRRGREFTAEQRQTYRPQLQAADSLLRKIEENNMIGMRQVGQILTPDQKARVRVLLDRDRRTDGDHDGRSSGNADRN